MNFLAKYIASATEIPATIIEIMIENINSLVENSGIISFRFSKLPFLDLFIVFRVIKENRIFNVVKLPVKINDSLNDIFVIDDARTADCEGPIAGRNVEKRENKKEIKFSLISLNLFISGWVIFCSILSSLFFILLIIEGIANNPESNGNSGSFIL